MAVKQPSSLTMKEPDCGVDKRSVYDPYLTLNLNIQQNSGLHPTDSTSLGQDRPIHAHPAEADIQELILSGG